MFVYGATGAGKTYTMLGNDGAPGIIYLTMRSLYEKIAELQDEKHFDIGISYLEVCIPKTIYKKFILEL